jgi:hypothetical protein
MKNKIMSENLYLQADGIRILLQEERFAALKELPVFCKRFKIAVPVKIRKNP